MATLKFRQLIDMAIGSPEPGHVNFYALHCLLSCIAEKLNIIDETVDYSKYESVTLGSASAKASNHDLHKAFGCGTRLGGGSDAEDIIEGKSNENTQESEAQPEVQSLTKDLETDKETLTETHDESAPEDPDQRQSDVLKEAAQDLGVVENPTAAVLSPRTSVRSNKINNVPSPRTSARSKKSDSHKNLHLDDRLTKVGLTVSEEFFTGVAIMKDQLQMVMEQLLLLTFLTLSKKLDTHRVQQLLGLAQTLRAIRNENVNIKGSNRFDLPTVPSIDWQSTDLQLIEEISEENILETQQSCSVQLETATTNPPNQYELNGCLCYSPEKMLDQLMELKGDFCLLTIKVNELSAKLVKQESQQTLALIQDLQVQMREVKLNITNMKEQQDRLVTRVTNNSVNIENNKKSMDDITAEKVDKRELEILLGDKVDYNQLQRKVSLDQMLEVQCRIDKRFSEVFRQINDNDQRAEMNAENLRQTLGFAAIEGILGRFKQEVANEIHSLHHALQKYVDSTNDDCAAAGGRIKVLQNLACISCDTSCVMRTVEKSKVAKLPDAHTSPSLSPLITYELGTIRKSGIMGYYRKDDFPHAPHAWLNRQEQQVVPRHAGGQHTTSSAQERVEKVLLNGK